MSRDAGVYGVNRRAKSLLIPILLFMLTGCGETEIPPLYGNLTAIEPGESPADVVCRIQNEFRALPKPLLDKMNYVGAWTSYRFGAASVDHRGYYKVELRPAGLQFLQQHSRLELVASLTPLLIDPEVGGEVAVLLAGTPAGNKAKQGMRTRSITEYLYETHYSSPSRPGDWFAKVYQRYGIARSLYGLSNTTEGIHRRKDPAYAGSLEQKLIEFLSAHGRAPLLPLKEKYLHIPQPHEKDLVERWIQNHGTPLLNSKAQAFIDHNKGVFAGIALLPLMPYPQRSMKANELYMMWLLGFEDDHWPAMLQATTGLNMQTNYLENFRKSVFDQIYKVCPSS